LELSVLTAASCAGPFSCYSNGAWAGGLQTATVEISGNFIVTSAAADSPCRTVWFQNAGTYYLTVDAGLNVSGAFTLNVEQQDVTTNAGDACSAPIGLSANSPVTVSSNNCEYTAGADDPAGALICAGTIENTTWLQFQSDGSGNGVVVDISNVVCDDVGYSTGAGFYGGSGQFGIVTSSTGACGGTYTSAAPCTNTITTGGSYNTTLPNTAVTNYFLVWDGNGGAECDFTISVTNVNPLPIELKYFTGTDLNGNVHLNWLTLSERNNDYFIIERSIDGINWSSFKTVSGNGSKSTSTYYEIVDDLPFNGLNYYRLKQVDYDGTLTESGITTVYVHSNRMSILLYPNPGKSNSSIQMKVSSVNNSKVNFVITNIEGKVINEDILSLKIGENSFEINHVLPSGIYFISVSNLNGERIIEKLIVE
jgi:hypothetical protein